MLSNSPAHTLRAGHMLPADPDARDVCYDFGKLVYRNHPVLTKIKRLMVSRSHQPADPGNAVVDITEGAGLLAVSPDLDFVISGQLCVCDFAAQCSRCLLPTALPGAVSTKILWKRTIRVSIP